MNRAAGDDLVALGEGFTTEFMRSGHVAARAGDAPSADVAGWTILLGAADDGDVVGIAETAGSSR